MVTLGPICEISVTGKILFKILHFGFKSGKKYIPMVTWVTLSPHKLIPVITLIFKIPKFY